MATDHDFPVHWLERIERRGSICPMFGIHDPSGISPKTVL